MMARWVDDLYRMALRLGHLLEGSTPDGASGYMGRAVNALELTANGVQRIAEVLEREEAAGAHMALTANYAAGYEVPLHPIDEGLVPKKEEEANNG